MVLKKALKILLGLAIVNAVISWLIALLYGESRILSFIPISGGYEVRGIFASTFFFGILLLVYLVIYGITPSLVGWIRKSFNVTQKAHRFAAGFFGQKAKEDIDSDFSLYLKKMISSIVILCGIIIIPVNYLMMSETQNSRIIGAFFVLVIISLFFLRKIYTLFNE